MIRALSIQDLLFENTVVECESTSGARFQRLVRIGMPRIPDNVIRSVFYLYRTPAEAREGNDPQATGFVVGMGARRSRPFAWRTHVYGVTNWHVAVDDSDPERPPAPVIRLNGADGKPHIIPLTPKDWRYIPGGGDIAVAPLDLDPKMNILCVPHGMFLKPPHIGRESLGIGDDVFMVGLFVDHHGGPKNIPAARFGNISMMPTADAPLAQPNLGEGEAFVLDVHSRSGFSGSPVFVYRTFGSDLTKPVANNFQLEVGRARSPLNDLPEVKLTVKHDTLFYLLGVHYAQFDEDIEVAGMPAVGLSGMTLAVPAWRILDVLELPELVQMRDEVEKRMEKEDKKKPQPEKAKRNAAERDDDGHRERFNRLKALAVKSPKSSG